MTRKLSINEGRKILRDSATHKEIQSAVTDYLDVQRIPYTETDATESYNRHGQRVRRVREGWPDVTACLRGGVLGAIEVKTAKDRLRPEQARTLHDLYLQGALICIARSVDDLVEVLKTWRIRDCDIAKICKYKDRPKKRRLR